MGAALNLLIAGPVLLYVAAFAVVIVLLEVFVRYSRYASILRWLTLSLFAYVATVFAVGVPWGEVARDLVLPHFAWSGSYLTVVVAIFGTTISPYLFFWQAAEEVEDEKENPDARPLVKAPEQAPRELARIQLDTIVGMGFSNVIALFIMLTTAATLHAHGVKDIETSSQAAEALRPIAGNLAFAVFALGIVGTGLLAVPVLAGSAAYARRRGLELARRSRAASRASEGVLRHDCRRDVRRRAIEFHAARSDQGAVLERRNQWRRGCADHGDDYAARLASGCDAGVRAWHLA